MNLIGKRDSENFLVGQVSCQLNLFLIICFLDMSWVHCDVVDFNPSQSLFSLVGFIT